MPEDPIPSFRFIAFSLVTDFQLAHAASPHDALERAALLSRKPGDRYLEILDCQHRGRDIWQRREGLDSVRHRYVTVFRGDGMAPRFPAVAMGEAVGELSLVDRDIDHYGAEVERLQAELKRCNIWQEGKVRRQIDMAREVIKSLLLFRLALKGE
jgi:hypothetical protein